MNLEKNGAHIAPLEGLHFGASRLAFGPAIPGDIESAKTILVVDEDLLSLLFSAQILANCGCTLLTAAGPTEAIELFAKYGAGIDLLIANVKMSAMSGYDLAKILRKSKPGLRVLCTCATLESECHLGNFSFIRKPFTWANLVQSAALALHSACAADVSTNFEKGDSNAHLRLV